ncbi:MAG: glycosyltransferase family 4 protein [Acidimicrobiales bacterium]
MRILLTHVYAWPEVRRGGERYLHELSAALVGAGHDVTVISTAPVARRESVLGVEVTYLPRRRWMRRYEEHSIEASFGLEVLARRAVSRLDVWHALGTGDGAAATTLARLRPRVRSVYTDLGNPSRAWRSARLDAPLHERIVRHADEYVCLSQFAARSLATDYGRLGRVIGGGVDMARFAPAAARSPEPTLLFSGAVDDVRKNLGLLLEAVGVLRRRGVAVRLVVSGPGDASEALAAAPDAARAVTDVVGVGSVEDLPRRYGEAWVTVLPSAHEAFGLVLLESLACGTPVVAMAEGGGPAELVTPDVGALAAASADGLADACEAALQLAARPQTADACRSAASAHDWRTGVVPALEAAYVGSVGERC